jgi:hypothetical protein
LTTTMNISGERIYNKAFDANDVVLLDVFPVKNGETILLTFESKNSEWSQGVWLMCDKGVEINGLFAKSAFLWYETAPKQIPVKCYTETGFLNIYNVWDRGKGPNSQSHTSGMLIEEIENGRRYRCNDIGLPTNFDKVIFTLEQSSPG